MKQFRIRLAFVCIVLALFGLAVISRLFVIQVIDGKKYALRSRSQTQQRRIIRAKRGAIFDRAGAVLASSIPGKLAVDMKTLGIKQKAAGEKAVLQRVYPRGEVCGPVLGYVGRDGYGLGGIEFSYDHRLRGEDGWEIIQKDGRRQKYRKIGLPEKEPKDGSDLYLTIDLDIQKIVQTVLKRAVADAEAKGGMCIVMNPHNGKILAMANEPSFNPNIPSQFSLDQRKNKCIEIIYEPGSTFKVVTGAVALQENYFSEQDSLDGSEGVYKIYDQVIRDHAAYDILTFTQALSVSSNVCFARIANVFGNDLFYRYSRDFGYGSKTGIDLPGEEEGILHPVHEWSGRTRVTMAMGHEISTTFLQMMLPFAAVANGGVLVTPVICDKVVSQSGKVLDTTLFKPVRRVISEDVASRLREMLEKVVQDGTGKRAAISGITVAGKTGTSRKSNSGGYSRNRHWSSFIGFLPADNPELLCGVVIDEPAAGETGGGAVAAPVFRKIMAQILSHPELEFAQKVLVNKKEFGSVQASHFMTSDYVGRTRGSVTRELDSLYIPFKFVGSGDTVRYQTPAAGSTMGSSGDVLLFTARDSEGEDSTRTVPDCVGKDLRDAFNILNLNGIQAYAIGDGIVEKQVPEPGKKYEPSYPCSLFCAERESLK
ncbi:MAG: penicillin-binding transpeptidase domain-containing protein [Chitinispirillaceae bacterium]